MRSKRNDRLVGIAHASVLFAEVSELADLPAVLLKQVEDFLVNYQKVRDVEVTPLGREAGIGEAIDVLLLMDESAFPACAVKVRLIGVIEGERLDRNKKTRNDRLVADAEVNHMYANIRRLKELLI